MGDENKNFLPQLIVMRSGKHQFRNGTSAPRCFSMRIRSNKNHLPPEQNMKKAWHRKNFLYNHYRIQWILQEIDNGGFIVKKRNGHRLLAALIAVGMCSSMQITLPQKSAAAVAVETTVQNQGLRSDPAYIRGSKAIVTYDAARQSDAVSYTHLTLPTILLV